MKVDHFWTFIEAGVVLAVVGLALVGARLIWPRSDENDQNCF